MFATIVHVAAAAAWRQQRRSAGKIMSPPVPFHILCFTSQQLAFAPAASSPQFCPARPFHCDRRAVMLAAGALVPCPAFRPLPPQGAVRRRPARRLPQPPKAVESSSGGSDQQIEGGGWATEPPPPLPPPLPADALTASDPLPAGLGSDYCDDFVCTSSPAVEASVRQLAKDIQRANGRSVHSHAPCRPPVLPPCTRSLASAVQ